MPRNIIKSIIGGDDDDNGNNKKIEGTVVLMKKNVLDFNDFNASVIDSVKELLGQRVSLQLISAVNGDPGNYFLIFSNFNNQVLFLVFFLFFMIFFLVILV
jgi:linoleate 9S-lipoxygenase